MPEGHTVHRTAKQLNEKFGGSSLAVSSPQGRFTDARLISGKPLLGAEAFGKQLFMQFETASLRIHLGIYGKWNFQSIQDQIPEPKGAVRARFLGQEYLADLCGPTACELVDESQKQQVLSRLGPDPLRKDADTDAFFDKAGKSRRPIGQLLMDQSILAGVGNVYRAEILFRNRVNPHLPGVKVSAEVLGNIWQDCVSLMPIGVRTGLMLTREGYLRGRPALADRYYVYKRQGEPCRECGSQIVLEIMATRKLYWCPKCQK